MHKIKLCFNEISLEISNLLICVCNSNKTSKLSSYNLNLLSNKNILYILIRISNKITLIKISTTMELELRKISIVRPYLSLDIITETTSTTIVSRKTHYRFSFHFPPVARSPKTVVYVSHSLFVLHKKNANTCVTIHVIVSVAFSHFSIALSSNPIVVDVRTHDSPYL